MVWCSGVRSEKKNESLFACEFRETVGDDIELLQGGDLRRLDPLKYQLIRFRLVNMMIFCIKSKELCIKNKELCITNDEFCR